MIAPALLVPKGALVVSCQARADNPLHGPDFMAAMAMAAEQGDAAGIRANGAADIAAIRRVTALPIIGLVKRWRDGESVYITPDWEAAREAAEAGADIIAIDATARPRSGPSPADLIALIQDELGRAALADIATEAEGLAAAAVGADYIATTLSGYTEGSRAGPGPDIALPDIALPDIALPDIALPDIALVERLARQLTVPVLAEGRYQTPAQVQSAFAAGAHAVVVGTAITNPREITRAFAAARPPGGSS